MLTLLSSQPGETEILAGGTDLIGLMQANVVRPDRVVNILEVPSLKSIEQLDNGVLAIGSVVTLDVLLDHPYLTPYPALQQAIEGIASMQLQCQGTLGGEVLQRPQCWFFRSGRGLLAGGGQARLLKVTTAFTRSSAIRVLQSSSAIRDSAPALVALNWRQARDRPGNRRRKVCWSGSSLSRRGMKPNESIHCCQISCSRIC